MFDQNFWFHFSNYEKQIPSSNRFESRAPNCATKLVNYFILLNRYGFFFLSNKCLKLDGNIIKYSLHIEAKCKPN